MNVNRTVLIMLLSLAILMFSSGIVLAGQVFNDVEEGRWSEQAIAEMKAKGLIGGVGDGNFAPTEPVTREQLVVMLVRAIGKADEAGGEIPVTYTYRDEVSSWAREAVAFAVREGIISGSDLTDRPGEPAKRYEVAVLALRAMDLEEEAKAETGFDLTFTDKNEIPQWALGYVALASKEGIMGGKSDGSFDPMGEITREEIAVVLSRIDEKLELKRDNVEKGIMYGVSAATDSIMVEGAGGSISTVPLADNCFIYREGIKVDYLALKSGDKLEIVKNSSGSAEYIEVLPEEEFSFDTREIEGEIQLVISGDPSFITIEDDEGSQSTYSFTEDVIITVDGEDAESDSLREGQKVTAVVDGQEVVEIEAENLQLDIDGRIVEVDDDDSITVEDWSGEEYTFEVTGDTEVEIDGDEAELEDLIPGQEVKVEAEMGIAELIEADNYEWELEGTFVEVDFADETITILNEDTEEEETYYLSKRVDVERDGDNASLGDLIPGDALEVKLENRVVEDIEAEPVEDDYEGRVIEIIVSTDPRIKIETEDGDEIEYKVSRDAEIEKDRDPIELSEINPGDWVEMETEGMYAVEIDVEPKLVSRYIIGKVTKVYDDDMVLIVEDRDSDKKETVILDDEVNVIKLDRFRDFDDIDEGDEVIVVGDPDKDYFKPVSVIIVSD